MRLIDADKLLEDNNIKSAIKYGNKNIRQENHSYSTMMMYEIAGIIEDAPTIEIPQWIPIEERLPEKNGYYLTTQVTHSLNDYSKILRHDTEYVEFMQGKWSRAKHLEIIAWQPLPKPYQKGTQ